MPGTNLDDLRRLLGKHVRTERPATEEEVAHYGHDTYGGEGVVVRVFEEDGQPWIAVDWGYAWAITPDTTITLLKRGGDG